MSAFVPKARCTSANTQRLTTSTRKQTNATEERKRSTTNRACQQIDTTASIVPGNVVVALYLWYVQTEEAILAVHPLVCLGCTGIIVEARRKCLTDSQAPHLLLEFTPTAPIPTPEARTTRHELAAKHKTRACHYNLPAYAGIMDIHPFARVDVHASREREQRVESPWYDTRLHGEELRQFVSYQV